MKDSLVTLQIYTTLKRITSIFQSLKSLVTLQIYTTLKQYSGVDVGLTCLVTLQIYTTLKPQIWEKSLRRPVYT